jgi:hypothetical protein
MISQALMMRPDLIEENVEQMKIVVLGALQRTPSNPTNSPDEETRVRSLSIGYAESFFQSLSDAVSRMRSTLGQSGRH